ncbi:MAG: BlaI/MecI/CopY family transcriptional regulator [Bacteroidota bacterium]
MKNKQLTRAEEDVMQILWQLEKCNVAAIVEQFPEPRPKYNTISTIVRILETKGFVGHEPKGKGYLYFPLIPKSAYSNQSITKLIDGYFQGSFQNMVSFFMKENDISVEELESILSQIKKEDND